MTFHAAQGRQADKKTESYYLSKISSYRKSASSSSKYSKIKPVAVFARPPAIGRILSPLDMLQHIWFTRKAWEKL